MEKLLSVSGLEKRDYKRRLGVFPKILLSQDS